MTAVKELRAEYQESFQAKYGTKLGFMSFFVKASLMPSRASRAQRRNREIKSSIVTTTNRHRGQ